MAHNTGLSSPHRVGTPERWHRRRSIHSTAPTSLRGRRTLRRCPFRSVALAQLDNMTWEACGTARKEWWSRGNSAGWSGLADSCWPSLYVPFYSLRCRFCATAALPLPSNLFFPGKQEEENKQKPRRRRRARSEQGLCSEMRAEERRRRGVGMRVGVGKSQVTSALAFNAHPTIPIWKVDSFYGIKVLSTLRSGSFNPSQRRGNTKKEPKRRG